MYLTEGLQAMCACTSRTVCQEPTRMASLLSKCGTTCPFWLGCSGKAPLGTCLRTSSSVLNTMCLTPAWCAHHSCPCYYIFPAVHKVIYALHNL